MHAAAEAGLRVAPQSTGHNAGPLAARGLDDVVLVRTSAMGTGRSPAHVEGSRRARPPARQRGGRVQSVPGGPDSSQDWKPMSEAGDIASSTTPSGVLQEITTWSG